MSSDFTITVTPGTVEAIQGTAVTTVAPTNGQVLTYDQADGYWRGQTPPSSLPPSGSAGGDLGGTYPNPTVIALQGHSVNSSSPTDGYVLTWDNADGYWIARPVTQSYTGLRQSYFTSSGTWTCPTGVTNVLVVAAGGGGGGAGGNGVSGNYGYGGGGGGCSLQQISYVSVTPGNNYTITIGSGGSGGATNTNGTDGNSTTFDTLFTVIGGGKGFQGYNIGANGGWNLASAPNGVPLYTYGIGYGGAGGIGSSGTGAPGTNGNVNGLHNGGSGGNKSSIGYPGGGGGGAGPQGNGGNGGNGTDSGAGGNGTAASNNTGAGGGGGGQGGGSGTNGTGNNGGSGYLYIIY